MFRSAAAHTGAREASCADFEVGVWGFNPKTGVVLSLPRLPARLALRTAVPLLLILRMEGGTGTTFTSDLIRHNR